MEEESVPTYTEVDSDSLTSWIDALPETDLALLGLPLTHWPALDNVWTPSSAQLFSSPPSSSSSSSSDDDDDDDDDNSSSNHNPSTTPNGQPSQSGSPTTPPPSTLTPSFIYQTKTRLITTLFQAIATKNTELVTLLITRGLVSPDIPNSVGTTPLIAAIEAGNGTMVCTLVALGARVNEYGVRAGQPRTPLMAAAALGRLPLVKLLREDFGADDSLIASDGQLALRLAAEGGHREVVEYLPVRRGGAWRRWRVHHEVAVRRIKRAGRNLYLFFRFFLWDVPRFLVWSCPKHVVVLPAVRSGRYCWRNRQRFGGWCKRQAVELPGRVKRGGQAVWRGVKKAPGKVWRVVKEVPRVMKKIVEAIWRVVKKIPGAMKAIVLSIWEGLKRVGKAVGDVFLRIVSAIHTAVMAVLDFFRSVTLRNVWNGLCDVFEAIFVRLPKAVWTGLKVVGEVALKSFLGLFGCLGYLIWFFFKGLLWVATYAPKQLWKIICGIGSSMAKGYHEIMVWFNPKH